MEALAKNKLGIVVRDDRVVVSSRTVAETFEKEHKNVLRDITQLGCSEEFRRLNFEPVYRYAPNGTRLGPNPEEFLLTRDGFVLLAMGYTGTRVMKFKEAYIAEFNRMENELRGPAQMAQFKIPKTLPDALRLAAEIEEKRLMLEHKNMELTPKAQAWDATCFEGTDMSLQAIGKEFQKLGVGPKKIFDFLSQRGVLYRLDGCWVPKQNHIDLGRFRVRRVNIILHGEPKTVLKTVVTPKGRDFVASLIGGGKAA